jgi:hypothetical protein
MNGNNTDQNITLIQIDNMLRAIAATHAMIDDYGEGLESEINTNTNSYPLLWCTVLPANIGMRTVQFNYRMFVLDRVNNIKDLLRVQSDSLRTLLDVIVLLRDYYDMIVDYDIQATPVVDNKPDMISGYYVEVHITTGYSLGICDVPEKLASYLVDSDNANIEDTDESLIDENFKTYR